MWTSLQKIFNRLIYVRAQIADRHNLARRGYEFYLDDINRSDREDADYGHETLTALSAFGCQGDSFDFSQKNVYKRERARTAGMCCPYGFCQEKFHYLHVDDLKEIDLK